MKYYKSITRFLPIFCLVAFSVLLSAQPKDNSPYSQFGIGDIQDLNLFDGQLMGSLGASFHSPYHINLVNPASLSYLEAAAFDVGVQAELSSLSDGIGNTSQQWNGNISNLTLAFPFKNSLNDLLDRKIRKFNGGMAFNLRQHSSVGYYVVSNFFEDNIGEVQRQFQGSGGTYEFSTSGGFRYKNFAGGLHLGYLFGKINQQRFIEFLDLAEANNSLVETSNIHRGLLYRFGLMYTHTFEEEVEEGMQKAIKKISFGLHANSQTSMTVDNDVFVGSASLIAESTFARDTFSFTSSEGLKGNLPAQLGIGATYYSGEKWALGLNFLNNSWSQYNVEGVNDNLNNGFKLSFGGYFRPNYKSIGSYFARVQYKFGFHYEKLPVVYEANNGDQLDDVGFSFGLGMPYFFQRKISHANLGLIAGVKGRNAPVSESYFRLVFSFTFNDDEWFLKRKYN